MKILYNVRIYTLDKAKPVAWADWRAVAWRT